MTGLILPEFSLPWAHRQIPGTINSIQSRGYKSFYRPIPQECVYMAPIQNLSGFYLCNVPNIIEPEEAEIKDYKTQRELSDPSGRITSSVKITSGVSAVVWTTVLYASWTICVLRFIEQAWGLVSCSELGELDVLLDKLSRSVAMNSSDFMSNGLLAFPFSGIRVVFFTDRSGGDVEAANRGQIVSYDEEYMILSAPDVDKLDPAEPPTALAGCYYAGSTSRTPVSVLKPLNTLQFGVFQKATAGFFLFRDLVPWFV
ncbi:hypothetical protein DFH06DRAFT_1122004 [Mycena polygramma]|nr:hypothetical protein DFH06DRAFT_1122004 [Mycena polygramma]